MIADGDFSTEPCQITEECFCFCIFIPFAHAHSKKPVEHAHHDGQLNIYSTLPHVSVQKQSVEKMAEAYLHERRKYKYIELMTTLQTHLVQFACFNSGLHQILVCHTDTLSRSLKNTPCIVRVVHS